MLAAQLWPEAEDQIGRHRLKQTALLIRRTLGFDPFSSLERRDWIRLEEYVESDLAAFDEAISALQWEMAVDRYTGPLLPLSELEAIAGARAERAEAFVLASDHARDRRQVRGQIDDEAEPDAIRLLAVLSQQAILQDDSATTDYDRPYLLRALSDVARALTAHERERLRRQHANDQVNLVRSAQQVWRGPQARAGLSSLDDARGDLELALKYLTEARPEDALRMAADLHWYWYVRGQFAEGLQATQNALFAARQGKEATHAQANALLALGHHANCLGDNTLALRSYARAKELYVRLSDGDGVASCQMRESNALAEQMRVQEALPLAEAAVQHFRDSGDEPNLLQALFYCGSVRHALDMRDEFRAAVSDGLSLARSLQDDRFLSLLLMGSNNMALVAAGGELTPADQRQVSLQLQEALACQRRLGVDALGMIYILRTVANLAGFRSDMHSAAVLLGMMQELRQRTGLHLHSMERHGVQLVRPATEAGSNPAYRTARQRGKEAIAEDPAQLGLAIEFAENLLLG